MPPVAIPARIASREHGATKSRRQPPALLLQKRCVRHRPQHVEPEGGHHAAQDHKADDRPARRAPGRQIRRTTCPSRQNRLEEQPAWLTQEPIRREDRRVPTSCAGTVRRLCLFALCRRRFQFFMAPASSRPRPTTAMNTSSSVGSRFSTPSGRCAPRIDRQACAENILQRPDRGAAIIRACACRSRSTVRPQTRGTARSWPLAPRPRLPPEPPVSTCDRAAWRRRSAACRTPARWPLSTIARRSHSSRPPPCNAWSAASCDPCARSSSSLKKRGAPPAPRHVHSECRLVQEHDLRVAHEAADKVHAAGAAPWTGRRRSYGALTRSRPSPTGGGSVPGQRCVDPVNCENIHRYSSTLSIP